MIRAFLTALVVLIAGLPSVLVSAQQSHHKHHHYKLIDIGTFGGQQNYINGDDLLAPYIGPAQNVNSARALIGWADTSTPDPYGPNFCFNGDCFVSHAFQWRDGFRTDLGVLPGGVNSASAWI